MPNVANTTSFKENDGKTYEVTINDEGTEISVARDNIVLGTIELDYREVDLDDEPDHYRITHLALEGRPFTRRNWARVPVASQGLFRRTDHRRK